MPGRDQDSTRCPGCGVVLPASDRLYDRKFHASAECWAAFEDVLAAEFGNAVLFGRVHQLTVDAYAAQHAGGRHPDKSVCIHLVGLYLVLERGLAPTEVPPRLQRLAARATWPHLEPPASRGPLTVADVAAARSMEEHCERVRAWAQGVWSSWAEHHDAIAALAEESLLSRP